MVWRLHSREDAPLTDRSPSAVGRVPYGRRRQRFAKSSPIRSLAYMIHAQDGSIGDSTRSIRRPAY
jgi:hypothetical protein